MQVFSPEYRYTDRINRILNYAHFNHQGGRLHLDQLTDIACLSKYHFIRLFQDQVGESPMRYLKRTRLERAGSLLKNETQLSVSEVALRCGFNSTQSFSREFGKLFEIAPRQFRTTYLNKLEDYTETGYRKNLFKQFTKIGIDSNLERSANNIQIKSIKPTRVAYIRSIGRYGGCNYISLSMEGIRKWAENRGLWSESSEFIGISWDFSSMTPDAFRRYDAAVEIPQNFTIDSSISSQTIPGGTYAVAKVSYQDVADLIVIWKWFTMALVSSKSFRLFRSQLNTGPWYEVYKRPTEESQNCIELYARLDPIW